MDLIHLKQQFLTDAIPDPGYDLLMSFDRFSATVIQSSGMVISPRVEEESERNFRHSV